MAQFASRQVHVLRNTLRKWYGKLIGRLHELATLRTRRHWALRHAIADYVTFGLQANRGRPSTGDAVALQTGFSGSSTRLVTSLLCEG